MKNDLEKLMDELCVKNPSLVGLRKQIKEVIGEEVESRTCIVCGNSLSMNVRFCSSVCVQEYEDANLNTPAGWPYK